MNKLLNSIRIASLLSLWLFVLSFCVISKAQISLVATQGTPTGTYTNFNNAFNAIRNGTHFGEVVLTVTANFTEPTTSTPLESHATFRTNSITIRAVGNPVVTTSGTTVAGRGHIAIHNIPVVIIDGDDMNTTNIERLTFTSTAGTSAFSTLKIINTATNNIIENISIKNVTLNGNINPTSTSTSVSNGIYIGGGTTTSTLAAFDSILSITIENVSIQDYNRGILLDGALLGNRSLIKNVLISKNTINVRSIGIDVNHAASDNQILRLQNNTITSIAGGINGTSYDNFGIRIRGKMANVSLVGNHISRVYNPLVAGTNQIAGIVFQNANVDSSTTIINNMISNVEKRKTTNSTAALSPSATYGILFTGVINVNATRNIAFNSNSIRIPQQTLGTTATHRSYCVGFINDFGAFTSFRNNLLVNEGVGVNNLILGATYGTFGEDYAYLFPNGNSLNTNNMDFNNYYLPNGGRFDVNNVTLEDWMPFLNFDRNSKSVSVNFMSSTDIHIDATKSSKIESAGTTIAGFNYDIDLETRPTFNSAKFTGTAFDIGADEFDASIYQMSELFDVYDTSLAPNKCVASQTLVRASILPGLDMKNIGLYYQFNSGTKTYLPMAIAPSGFYEAIIPAPAISSDLITYEILFVDFENDTIFNGKRYVLNDIAKSIRFPNHILTPDSACINKSIKVGYSFPNRSDKFRPGNTIFGNDSVEILSVMFNKTLIINNFNNLLTNKGFALGNRGTYTNTSNITQDTLMVGKPYNFEIEIDNKYRTNTFVKIFMDVDGDGFFNGVGEEIFTSLGRPIIGRSTLKGQFYIPLNALQGWTRLRFVASSDTISTATTPLASGEVEDYKVLIQNNSNNYIYYVNNVLFPSLPSNPVYTPSVLPTFFDLQYTDINGCVFRKPVDTLHQSVNPLKVDITSNITQLCFDDIVTLIPKVYGGCAPFTYSWSNGFNKDTLKFTAKRDTTFTLTLTDANGSFVTSSVSYSVQNDKNFAVSNPDSVCERGYVRLTASTLAPPVKTYSWYENYNDNPYNSIFEGNIYNSRYIQQPTSFYVNSKTEKLETSLVTVPPISNFVGVNSGMFFNIYKDYILDSCFIYANSSGGSVVVGILDIEGNIIFTSERTFINTTSSATATTIKLGALLKPGNFYSLVLLEANDIFDMRFVNNLNAIFRNVSANGAIQILGANNFGNLLPTFALNFFNIRGRTDICFSEKVEVPVKYVKSRSLGLTLDLTDTAHCTNAPLSLKVQGGSAFDSIVWLKDNNIVKVDYPSSNKDAVLNIPALTQSLSGLYRARLISKTNCYRDTTSKEVLVKALPLPQIQNQTSNPNVCVGSNLVLKAMGSDLDSISWIVNSGVPIKKKATDTLMLNNFTTPSSLVNVSYIAEDKYKCGQDFDIFNITVHDNPKFVSSLKDTTLCQFQDYKLNANFDHANTYEWYRNGELLNSSFDFIDLAYVSLKDSGSYYVLAKSYPGCQIAASDTMTIRVVPKAVIKNIPEFYEPCEGSKLSLTSNTENSVGYQWFKSPAIPLGSTKTLEISTLSRSNTGTYYYKAISENNCGEITSPLFSIDVKPLATSTAKINDFEFCTLNRLDTSFVLQDASLYQWVKNGIDIQGQDKSRLSITSVGKSDEGLYYLKYRSHINCPFSISDSFKITTREAPLILTQPEGALLCEGSNYTLNVVANNQAIGYQWLYNGNPIQSAVSPTLNLTNLSSTNAGNYRVNVLGQAPCAASLPSFEVTVDYIGFNKDAVLANTSQNNLREVCTDKNGWTYFAPPNDNKKIYLAIQKNGNIFEGKANIEVRSSPFTHIVNSRSQLSGTVMLSRYWNIDGPASAMNNPMKVKFYHSDIELNKLEEIYETYKTTFEKSPSFSIQDITWFQTVETPFTNSLLQGVRGNELNFDVGQINTTEGRDNGISYKIFDGIRGPSGGTAYFTFKGANQVFNAIKESKDIDLEIYPNPAEQDLYIQIPNSAPEYHEITLYDALGRLLTRQEALLSSQATVLDIAKLAPGTYMLHIKNLNSDLNKTKSFIKK
ncbi:MAG: T9SS type A sorting domain-containing protein [Chitinophagales bacterium]|nr:T9SS type A sorting domain-containing protein [Chitinophagales bacterium]